MNIRSLLHVAGLLLIARTGIAGDVVLHSGPQQVHLLELFTSEGCSSCPPAEAQLSTLKDNPALWKGIVPVAFHVNYWDYLGWPDRFASAAYTERQRTYASAWGSDSVYTPSFVLDGRESHWGDIPEASGSGGELMVTLGKGRELKIAYQAAGRGWQAHVATLGMGLETDVRAGENGGRRIRHDFIALGLVSTPLGGANVAQLTLPPRKEGEQAIAVWVTQGDQIFPVQAVGRWE